MRMQNGSALFRTVFITGENLSGSSLDLFSVCYGYTSALFGHFVYCSLFVESMLEMTQVWLVTQVMDAGV